MLDVTVFVAVSVLDRPETDFEGEVRLGIPIQIAMRPSFRLTIAGSFRLIMAGRAKACPMPPDYRDNAFHERWQTGRDPAA